MKAWQKVACVAALVSVSTGVGAAVAQQGADPGSDPGVVASGVGGVRDLGAGLTQSTYIPVTPCRIVDTRLAGGAIGDSVTRTFEVRGTTGFVPQGGKSGGCGIPTGATAVELSLTTVDPTGGGYMRVYPGGASEPTATFINYSPYNPTNTGSVTLCSGACGSGDLSVRGHGTSTDVVIDVQGYYAKPMAAQMDASGSVLRSSRVVSTVKSSTGVYRLTFDRNISTCVAFASPYYANQRVAAVQAEPANTVLVVMYDKETNTVSDGTFAVQVIC